MLTFLIDPMFIPGYCTWKIIRHSEFKNELSSKYLAPWSSFLNKQKPVVRLHITYYFLNNSTRC